VRAAAARRLDNLYILALASTLLLGLAVRLSFVLGTDFPLHDGGLFYAMVRDLERSHYALPDYASYNAAHIPFVYPPLGFYLAAVLDSLLPWGLWQIFRFLPLAINVLTIGAFMLLSRALLSSRLAIVSAVLAFALFPMAFQWLIMGGGLTRAPGFFFALLAIHQAYLLYTRRERKHLWAATLLSSCAVLSHPAMAWFTAYSVAFLFLARGRDRAGLIHSLLWAGGTLAATAPWWGLVLARHGVEPLLAAFVSSRHQAPAYSGLLNLLTLRVANEPFSWALGFPALLGGLVCLRKKRWLVPGWLAISILAQSPVGLWRATAPLALLAGIGAAEGLRPLLAPTRDDLPVEGDAGRLAWRRYRLLALVLAFLLLHATAGAFADGQALMQGLSSADRAAMHWVASQTPADSSFLVVTGKSWWLDDLAEWFPVLAQRQSVATPQGYEWEPGFADRLAANQAAERCAAADGNCLENWTRETGIAFSHLYVAKAAGAGPDPSGTLRCALQSDPRYELLYDGPAASVYRRMAHHE